MSEIAYVDEELTGSVCQITNDVIHSSAETQDILIGNLAGQEWFLTIDGITKCIDDNSAVIVTDLRINMQEKKLRKASVIILTISKPSKRLISSVIKNHLDSIVWHHMAKVLCIVPENSTLNDKMILLDIFFKFGFYNVAVAFKLSTHKIIYTLVKSRADSKIFLTNPSLSSSVFPDKLKNLEGYKYRIPVYHQPPKIMIYPHYIRPAMAYFFYALHSVQNSRFEIIRLPKRNDLDEFWERREMDLTFNDGSYFVTSDPKLFIYETKGYCALVPIPPKIPLYHQIFILPFDALIWLLFGVSVVSSIVVWRMFRCRGAVDSHWSLAVGIFTMFIGQGAEFSRRNRFVLAFLLNIICMSVFLLSNLYEGAITSFMIEPTHENRLRTAEDLLNSNFDIVADDGFLYLTRDDPKYQVIKSRVKMLSAAMAKRLGHDIINNKDVFVRSCELLELDLALPLKTGGHISDFYYMLPEKLISHYVQLEASFLNPFIERLQFYMDLSFQAGLPHMWKVLANQNNIKQQNDDATVDSDEYLKLKDLGPIFGVLVIGLFSSFLGLIVEIFFHDCVRYYSLCSTMGKLKKLIALKCYHKGEKGIKKLNIRRIQVRPT